MSLKSLLELGVMGQVVRHNAVALSVATHTFLAELVHPSPEGPSGDPGPSQH